MLSWISPLLCLTIMGIVLGSPRFLNTHQPDEPKALEQTAPAYPPIANAAHAMGKVVVAVEVDQQGNVAAASVTSGHPLLQAVSRKAALTWRFEPDATRAQTVSVNLTFDFVYAGDSLTPDKEHCGKGYAVVANTQLLIYGIRSMNDEETVENHIPEGLEGTLCKVHHEPLLKDRVDISYGLISFRPGYLKVEKKSFPNANDVAYGGCVIESELDVCSGKAIQVSPKYADVLYCPACRRAHEHWTKTHPRKS